MMLCRACKIGESAEAELISKRLFRYDRILFNNGVSLFRKTGQVR